MNILIAGFAAFLTGLAFREIWDYGKSLLKDDEVQYVRVEE